MKKIILTLSGITKSEFDIIEENLQFEHKNQSSSDKENEKANHNLKFEESYEAADSHLKSRESSLIPRGIFKISKSPIYIQNDISNDTTFLVCHKPTLSEKHIFTLFKEIPIISICSLYDFNGFVQKLDSHRDLTANSSQHNKIDRFNTFFQYFLKYKMLPLSSITFFGPKSSILVENYLKLLGAVKKESLVAGTDLYITEELGFVATPMKEHEKFCEKFNVKVIKSSSVLKNKWDEYLREQNVHFNFIQSQNCDKQKSANDRLFENRIFFISPEIDQFYQSQFVKLIISNGGIRTSRYKNVDFIICSGLSTEESQNNLSELGESSLRISPSFLFHSIQNGILLHPSTFTLYNKSISLPLKDTTVLIKKNTVVGQNTLQNMEICFNKLKIMGARIKTRFDSSVTHIITDIFDEQNDLPIKKVPLNWVDKCLKNLEVAESKFIETKRTRNIVNKMLGRSASSNRSSVNYDMKTSDKIKTLSFCFSTTPQTLKTRITKHLEQYLGDLVSFTEDVEKCDFIILGQLKLNEKLIIAMIRRIQVIKASEYDLDQITIDESKNSISERDSTIANVKRILKQYKHTSTTKKEQQIIDSLNYWKNEKNVGTSVFKNWRVWIRADLKPTDSNFTQQETKIKSLQKIIKAGGGESSLVAEGFSFTHIVTDKNEMKNGEKSFDWVLSYILKRSESVS